jgi:hypothetical protein
MEQVAGAGIASVIVLGYLLLVEVLTAAIVLLAHFIVLQVRALRGLTAVEPKPMPVVEPLSREAATNPQVVIGGGIRKWE